MSEKTVILTKDEGVAIIKLNRPKVYNAFNEQMSQEYIEVLKNVSEDSTVRAVVLTGEGKAFCSGQDLNDRKTLHDQGESISLGDSVRNRYNPMIKAVYYMEKPIVAAVNGPAAGAGCSLALACDFRFITPETRFIQAFVNIGLIPDSGSTFFLPRLIGSARALEMAMTGKEVRGEEAVNIGLANYIVPTEKLLDEAIAFAKKLANGPTVAIGLIKKAMRQTWTQTLEEALEFEAVAQDIAGKTEDFKEGVQAFSQKRKPEFKGR